MRRWDRDTIQCSSGEDKGLLTLSIAIPSAFCWRTLLMSVSPVNLQLVTLPLQINKDFSFSPKQYSHTNYRLQPSPDGLWLRSAPHRLVFVVLSHTRG